MRSDILPIKTVVTFWRARPLEALRTTIATLAGRGTTGEIVTGYSSSSLLIWSPALLPFTTHLNAIGMSIPVQVKRRVPGQYDPLVGEDDRRNFPESK